MVGCCSLCACVDRCMSFVVGCLVFYGVLFVACCLLLVCCWLLFVAWRHVFSVVVC